MKKYQKFLGGVLLILAMLCSLTACACKHDWTEATCEKPKTCAFCGAAEGSALGHTIQEWSITKESTCTEAGAQTGVCAVCGKVIEQACELKAHTPGEWSVAKSPTAYSKGTRVKCCTVCGKELESENFEMSEEEREAQYKSLCEKIAYKDLERTPDDYKWRKVKFSGTVVQICYEAESEYYYSEYRVATSGQYDNVVYLLVDNYGSGSRILEDDYITFYGESDGLYTYTSVRGDSITIPQVTARYVE